MTTIDYGALQMALRARLLTMVVATTGATTLSRTTTGYVRASGSFVTEKFARGMELTPSGFPTNAPATIIDVTALVITVSTPQTAAIATSGRSLTVGLPSIRAWENARETGVTRVVGVPYVEEQFDPGAAAVTEVGRAARREARPIYSPRIFVPQGTGIDADGRYSDAVLNLFPPGHELTCSDGTLLCVMSRPAPTKSTRSYEPLGWSCIPVDVPCYTRN